MAVSVTHKGWKTNRLKGILGAVYDGAISGAVAHDANTALDGILVGTPVTPALAVDSMVISDTVASGDFLLALNRGGNSENYIFGDASAGTLTLYAPNGALTLSPTSDVVIGSGKGLLTGSTSQLTISNGDGATDLIPELQGLGVGTAFAGGALALATFNTTNTRAVAPRIALVKGAAATQVATTAVADDEVVGAIMAFSSDGTDFETPVGSIEFVVDDAGGPGAGAIGGSIEFYSTADGGEVLTKAFTIDNVQNIMGAAAAGPAIATNESATTTNPTLIPDKAEMDTGIGWASDTLHIVLGGATKANFSTTALTLTAANLSFSAASDIVVQANTAAALEVSDGTVKMLAFDSRDTLKNVSNLTITGVAPTVASATEAHINASLNIAAKTITYTGTTGTTSSLGAQLYIAAPTFTDASSMTLVTVSSVHIAAVAAAGGSLTISNSYMISTGVADCYLTNAGVWTDTVSTRKIKQDIQDLDYSLMPALLEGIRPVSFKYDPERLNADDLGRSRYGVIAEELPEFLRVPGDSNPSAMSGTILGAFGLASIRYLYDENKMLKERLAQLELKAAA